MLIKGSVFKLILGSLFTLGLGAAAIGVIYMLYIKTYAPTLLDITRSDPGTESCQPVLHFRDNSQNEAGFRLYRYPTNNDFTLIKTFPAEPGMGGQFVYTDTDILPTGTYFYKISAYNKFGESYSDIKSVYLEYSCVVNTPTGPSAPPVNPIIVSLSIINDCNVRITYRDNSTNETGFKIVRFTANSALTIVAILGPHAGIPGTYDDKTKLPPGKYAYFINVFNQKGNTNSNTSEIEVTSVCNPTMKLAPTVDALMFPTAQKLSAEPCNWQAAVNVFLRKGPDIVIYNRLVDVEAGKGFPIIGQSEDGYFWAVEVSPGVVGYITKSETFSRTNGDCSSVPTLKDPPPPVIEAAPTRKPGGNNNGNPATPCPVGAVCP